MDKAVQDDLCATCTFVLWLHIARVDVSVQVLMILKRKTKREQLTLIMIPSHTFFSPISHAGNKGTRSPRPSICLQLTARTRGRRRTASSTTTIIHKKKRPDHTKEPRQSKAAAPTHLTSPQLSSLVKWKFCTTSPDSIIPSVTFNIHSAQHTTKS